MSFEITFLGASGGPIEGTNCSILVKPSHLSYETIINQNLKDEVICIDAGSGLLQLSEIIHNEQLHQQSNSKLLHLYNDSLPTKDYISSTKAKGTNIKITTPFKSLKDTCFKSSQSIFNNVQTYLITHPHLDHINALVINSSSFSKLNPKQIFGSNYTIDALKVHIFNGIIWPKLNNFNLINLISKPFWHQFSINNDNYNITMFDLSHGVSCSNGFVKHEDIIEQPRDCNNIVRNEDTCYLSSAFLIESPSFHKSLLIFGDFESDLMSNLSKNKRVWNFIAPIINSNQLSGIILECSNQNDSNEDELYGHLIPNHLIHELKYLESKCISLNSSISKPLQGLNIIVNHIKEPLDTVHDPRQMILQELNNLNDLGVQFSIGLSGVSVII
ncbi:3',5'-cyclic-nucleotide phosphodiesterase (3':5'-CNP) [Scheffersomyces coipomensis]|uniref:3',5'-cyclic-nucleotide phosphodiesterase (3':5'-CNP) n=1 Tax=Scheffersomyces coipomensis TaxID=1788519 RepID=UPI00315D8BB5